MHASSLTKQTANNINNSSLLPGSDFPLLLILHLAHNPSYVSVFLGISHFQSLRLHNYVIYNWSMYAIVVSCFQHMTFPSQTACLFDIDLISRFSFKTYQLLKCQIFTVQLYLGFISSRWIRRVVELRRLHVRSAAVQKPCLWSRTLCRRFRGESSLCLRAPQSCR